MSGTVNKIILIGRLGKDPEVRYTTSGDPVASFPLATSEVWRDKAGTKQEHTDWHRVEIFGKAAEFVRDFAQKGSLVSVEGSVRYEEWTDKEGKKRNSTKIRAQRVELLAAGRSKPVTETDESTPF